MLLIDNEDINKKVRKKRIINMILRYGILTIIAFIMLYPMIWLLGSSLKSTNTEIFSSIGFLPKKIEFNSYIEGWKTNTQFTFATYFANTFKMVIPKVILTVISSGLVSYGFARFNFPYKKILFAILISTLFLPGVVTGIPMYILWSKVELTNTYIPLVIGSAFATNTFYVFMLVQFLRGIPRDLDEAAIVDGCGPFKRLIYIIAPILKPSLITVALFEFMGSMGDFMGPLIYISYVEKYPVALALRMAIDTSSASVQWNQTIAISLIGLLPSILVFFLAQKYFVEGVAATGIKG